MIHPFLRIKTKRPALQITMHNCIDDYVSASPKLKIGFLLIQLSLTVCSITRSESFVKILSGSVNFSAVSGNTVFFVFCGADFNRAVSN